MHVCVCVYASMSVVHGCYQIALRSGMCLFVYVCVCLCLFVFVCVCLCLFVFGVKLETQHWHVC